MQPHQTPDGFFAMGGYGAFIWPAYAAALIIILGLAWLSLSRLRRAEKQWKQISSTAIQHDDEP